MEDDPTADNILATQTVCEQTSSSAATLEVLNPSLGINNSYNYEWFDITAGLPGISVGTGNTFTPPTNNEGVFSYYCEISNNPTNADCKSPTNTHIITVNPAPEVITPPQDVTICVGGNVDPLNVQTPNLDPTTNVTREWFDITAGLPGISVSQLDTYTPNTTNPGTFLYHCVLTFSSAGCSQQISDVITIQIEPDPSILSLSLIHI